MTARTTAALLGGALLLGGCATTGRAPQPAQSLPPQPVPPLTALRLAIDSMVARPEYRNAHWGVLIVDPERGDTLYSHNAGKLFMPASNMKIVTGAVALAQLGADFRFATAFAARGVICDSVLHGDLVVDGRGDPSVSDAMRGDAMVPLREIADSLAARGIARITGALVAGDDAFPDSSLGFGWSWDDLGASYSAGVDELFFNEGFGRVVVRGGKRVGAPVVATVLPDAHYPALRVAAVTAAPPPPDTLAVGSGGRVAGVERSAVLEATMDHGAGAVVVGGWIAPNAVDTIEVVFPDQRAAYLDALGEALAARGIAVEHGAGAKTAAARRGRGAKHRASRRACRAPRDTTERLDTLFVYQSLPLRDVLRAMLKPSQNQIAEILLKTIALQRTGVGRADSGASVVAKQLLAWGAQPDGFIIRDGSGLSRYDYVTPETLVHVLAAIQRDTAFSAFYDGLPIAGVDGTIAHRMRGTPAAGNVHAKTGFVANARSLSGYVTTADGHVLIFSALCNNWTAPVRDIERVQDAIAARLAALTLAGAR
jgi:D-alanyl-D-alanine carboxypeptidase/D-alanyl-D-alanine-endopeptidase (penicillin-binding protein 4)